MNNIGIDIKQYKKWLTKEVGKRCAEFEWDCDICQGWQLYDELKSYLTDVLIED